MRDSLLSRFRGAFLGVIWGYGLERTVHTPDPSPNLPNGREKNERPSALSSAPEQHWVRAELRGIQRMIAQTQTMIGGREPNLTSSPGWSGWQAALTPVELFLGSLPLALFYHDQPRLYQAALQEQASRANVPEAVMFRAWVLGHTLSLMLRERLVVPELPSQLLKDLDLSSLDPELADQLRQIETWLAQPITLANLAHQLKLNPNFQIEMSSILLALYSFLSTPDHPQLSLLRSARLHPSCHTPMLTGALTGAYNGWARFPIPWHQQLQTDCGDWAPLVGLTSVTEISALADGLLALWSGAVDPVDWLQQQRLNCIVAAPRVIQSSSTPT